MVDKFSPSIPLRGHLLRLDGLPEAPIDKMLIQLNVLAARSPSRGVGMIWLNDLVSRNNVLGVEVARRWCVNGITRGATGLAVDRWIERVLVFERRRCSIGVCRTRVHYRGVAIPCSLGRLPASHRIIADDILRVGVRGNRAELDEEEDPGQDADEDQKPFDMFTSHLVVPWRRIVVDNE